MLLQGETFIGFSAVTAVVADSNSITDTVDTDSLTVVAMNRCCCRQIYWQLLAEKQSEYKNASVSRVQVQNRIFSKQELTPQKILIPQPFL